MKKRFVLQEMPDILQIVQIVKVTIDDDEDGDMAEGGLEEGEYAVDSKGGFWAKKQDVSEMLAILDINDPHRKKERIEARERWDKAKKKRRKRDNA